MAIAIAQCSQQGCRNTFTYDDSLAPADVELMALGNGWSKQADGSWRGCEAPVGCPMVEVPAAEARPTPGLFSNAGK